MGSTALSVVGHTDTVGSLQYNQGLSERRARRVGEGLVQRGIPANSMTLAGRSYLDPAVQTGDERPRAAEPARRDHPVEVSATRASPETDAPRPRRGAFSVMEGRAACGGRPPFPHRIDRSQANGARPMPHIRQTATAVLLAMYGVTGPAAAEDQRPAASRLERALRDMMQDMQPTLDQALDYMRSLGAIDDPLNYEMPEVLPNGDIIIRRRPDAPALGPEGPEPPGAPPATPETQPTDPQDGVRI